MRLLTTMLIAAAPSIAACGDKAADEPTADAAAPAVDAPVWTGGCWPVETAAPGGSVELGHESPFMTMPDQLRLGYGPQGGYMFIVNVRQSGFGAGDLFNPLNVTNPRTKIRVYFADTGLPLAQTTSCGIRNAYKDTGDGYLELPFAYESWFDTCWREIDLVGKQFRIDAEILDWNGTTYAKDSHIVTALAATTTHPDDSSAPGCP